MSRTIVTVTLTVDHVVLQADVPVGATLEEFLIEAGYVSKGPLASAHRLLDRGLELAVRHQRAELTSDVPSAWCREVPALVADRLVETAV